MKNLFLLITLGSLIFESCKKDEYPKTVEIEYKVEADSGISGMISSLFYCNDTGGTTTGVSVPFPFIKTFSRVVNRNDTIYISALNADSITEHLEIYVDGSKVAEDSASGVLFVNGYVD